MSKVTSKLQVTIPKSIATEYGIEPGTEVFFEPAGEAVRLRVGTEPGAPVERDVEWRLRLFDAATARQRERERSSELSPAADRGWTRDDLYGRAVPR